MHDGKRACADPGDAVVEPLFELGSAENGNGAMTRPHAELRGFGATGFKKFEQASLTDTE